MCLKSIKISPSEIGFNYSKDIEITYQKFGKPFGTAPIVLVNHALTGNSSVTGVSGWWNKLIGDDLPINTKYYTVLAFDIPGNGYDDKSENLITNYKIFSTKIIAELYWKALNQLNIKNLFAVIGGSLGGSIAWEMAFLEPNRIKKLIPIACTLKASDWLIANVFIQEQILNRSTNPIEDARIHAMLLYRTPKSLNKKFNNEFNSTDNIYKVESWLNHHAESLKKRFRIESYKLMNHLLKTIGNGLTKNDFIQFIEKTSSEIVMVAIDSDYMFTEKEQKKIYKKIVKQNSKIEYHTIKSIHGHDAFLIEYQQLSKILTNHF